MLGRLSKVFIGKNYSEILKISAEIGHYIADSMFRSRQAKITKVNYLRKQEFTDFGKSGSGITG